MITTMVDLRTTYLGLDLEHPIIPGASPLVDNIDMVRRLEDAGAPCIVMHSLFEEQVRREQQYLSRGMEPPEGMHAEATTFLPRPGGFVLGPQEYLEQLRRIRQLVSVPVIASLNGVTAERWLEYARLMQDAGASAIELNIYHLPADPTESGESVERRTLDVVRWLRATISIPLAVKLSPFYSSPANFALQLDRIGADGLVLFNRFYQPDIDTEELEVVPHLHLSDSSELLLRLRWIAILSGRVRASLAVTGGVHSSQDVVKAVMAGADVVQTVSALLKHGPERLRVLRDALGQWMEEHGYESLRQLKGNMSLQRCPDPTGFERANYMRVLQSWRD
jgi:dihydroorotate dehydrogenase (fumarate)